MVLNRIGENNFTMIEKDSKHKPYMLLIQFGKEHRLPNLGGK
jgi:hypothetical protein